MPLLLRAALTALLSACAAPQERGGAPLSIKDASLWQRYRPSLLHGELLYCRSESVTGTQFRSTVCVSEQQIREQEQNTRDTAESRAMHPNLQCHNQSCSQ